MSPDTPQTSVPASAPASAQTNMPAVESDEKIFAFIGYLAFLFVVPLIAKPKSKFCELHAKQSMVMFLVTIVVLVVLAAIPLIGSILTLALFALYILAIYRAFTGDWWKIPVISAFSEKIDLSVLYGKAGLSTSGLSSVKDMLGQAAGKMEEGIKKMGQQESPKEPPQPSNPSTTK